MKISALVKQLNKYKKEYGDVIVVFNECSINEDVIEEYSQHTLTVKGAFYVSFENGDTGVISSKKCLVLDSDTAVDHEYGNTPARKVK